MLAWTIAETEAEREEAMRFICRHGANLGLLYNWSTIMNSIVYCIEDKGLLLGKDRDGKPRGVLAHTIGTLDDGYKDKGRIEIHLLYLEESWRTGSTLSSAFRLLMSCLRELAHEPREIVFFAPASGSNRRKYGRSAQLAKTTEPPCGRLDYYTVWMSRMLKFDRS